METTHEIKTEQQAHQITVTSSTTLNDEYRRAFVNGRRFDMMRVSYRAKNPGTGRRQTYNKWLISERRDDGSFLTALEAQSDPSTVAAAHRVIARFVITGKC